MLHRIYKMRISKVGHPFHISRSTRNYTVVNCSAFEKKPISHCALLIHLRFDEIILKPQNSDFQSHHHNQYFSLRFYKIEYHFSHHHRMPARRTFSEAGLALDSLHDLESVPWKRASREFCNIPVNIHGESIILSVLNKI